MYARRCDAGILEARLMRVLYIPLAVTPAFSRVD
jgi:hypothetical protein